MLMFWHVAMAIGTCDNMAMTDKCCKDGTPDDYPCRIAQKCGRGQCIATAANLCTDGPDGSTDYVCATAEKCGRGICVGTTDTLCGTTGTTVCPITTTCCGTSAATKNSDMVCNTMMDTCPADRISDTYDYPNPYVYSEAAASSDSAAASLGSGALGKTLLAVTTATLLHGLLL